MKYCLVAGFSEINILKENEGFVDKSNRRIVAWNTETIRKSYKRPALQTIASIVFLRSHCSTRSSQGTKWDELRGVNQITFLCFSLKIAFNLFCPPASDSGLPVRLTSPTLLCSSQQRTSSHPAFNRKCLHQIIGQVVPSSFLASEWMTYNFKPIKYKLI